MVLTIGTISFARCGDGFDVSPSERIRLILAAVHGHGPAILLTGGHAVNDRKGLRRLAEALPAQESATSIVTEVHHDGKSGARRLSGHALYAIAPDGSWTRLGRQVFARREETRGKDEWRVALFVARLARRLIVVGGRRVFALGCGEINAVMGASNPRFIDPAIDEAIASADIVLNPTHDRMGRAGLLDAKRRFLSLSSRGRCSRVYVSCSNWNQCTANGIPQYPSATIHTCYVDGVPVEPELEVGGQPWGFLYRQYAIGGAAR